MEQSLINSSPTSRVGGPFVTFLITYLSKSVLYTVTDRMVARRNDWTIAKERIQLFLFFWRSLANRDGAKLVNVVSQKNFVHKLATPA